MISILNRSEEMDMKFDSMNNHGRIFTLSHQ